MVLSTSPISTLAYDTGSDIFYSNNGQNRSTKTTILSLQEFTDALPPLLRRLKSMERSSLQGRMQVEQERGTKNDPVTKLFSRLDLNEPQLKEYALSEPCKNYTRNLVAADNETYTLLLLCWNPGKQSPIHDHPCDGCWVRVVEGSVKETRYEMDENDNSLSVTSVDTYEDNKAVSYINDYMGYHKVENPSANNPAVTLHLYCPPFEKCKIWLDPSDASRTSKVCMCNYSEYGDSHACERFAVNMI
ncbi:hypothetical protein ACHAWO_010891 [Cyclotella atomus]|uniref:Cysteine dioxygenase n=1 Tax=Cyclotella atomus TaxID=382360 RepID=A0ABD3PT71_9STRA